MTTPKHPDHVPSSVEAIRAGEAVDLKTLVERMHVIISETKRCVDDDRLLRAQDKLNYLCGLVDSLSLLASRSSSTNQGASVMVIKIPRVIWALGDPDPQTAMRPIYYNGLRVGSIQRDTAEPLMAKLLAPDGQPVSPSGAQGSK